MSLPLRDYTELDSIRARLEVLYAKADRIVRYNDSCEAGAPDVGLLDERQLLIFERRSIEAGASIPGPICRSLRRSIDVLEKRRIRLERKQAA